MKPSQAQVALELCSRFSEAGWEQADANFKPRPFVMWMGGASGGFFSAAGSPDGKAFHAISCQSADEVLKFLESMKAKPVEAEPEPVAQVEPPAPVAEPEPTPVTPLGYEDEAPDLAAENEALRARAEAAEKRLAELEARDAPVGLPPNPSETKLSDYYIPAEIRDLMEEGETFPQARKRLSELLNVEKAELRLKRAAGSATEAELKREADVDRLQGLFSKLGEI